jgi:hypothetical protein
MATRIEINPKYQELRPFIESIPEIFEIEGRIIYQQRNLIKVFSLPTGMEVNVKRYCRPIGIKRYIYSLGIRKSKCRRAFEYPAILLAKGIETPEPIAYIEKRTIGILGYSYFISVQCDYPNLMYDVLDLPDEEAEPLAVAFAKHTAKMHKAGILHRDYSPGNILWKRMEDGNYHFSIIDINRMRFRHIGMKTGCDNLKRIWGTKQFMRLVAETYAEEMSFDKEKTVELVMKYRAKFWKIYGLKHEIPFDLEL